MLKDEHQALQLAFASLEEKLRKTQVFITIIYIYIILLSFNNAINYAFYIYYNYIYLILYI